jgi:hypothetical protein
MFPPIRWKPQLLQFRITRMGESKFIYETAALKLRVRPDCIG